MLRSVILLVGIILVAVVLIAPSLPTPKATEVGTEGPAPDTRQSDLRSPSSPDSVDRLFQSDDQGVIVQPDLAPRPANRSDGLVDLPPTGSAQASAGRADEN